MKTMIITLVLILLSGCYNTKVETIKHWEGHYFTTNELYNASQNIELEKGESIWMISNYTLKRLLNNTGH